MALHIWECGEMSPLSDSATYRVEQSADTPAHSKPKT